MSLLRLRKNMSHMLQWVMGAIAVIFVLGIFFSFNLGASTTGPSPSNEVFARIGDEGEEITLLEYQQTLQSYRQSAFGGAMNNSLAMQLFLAGLVWDELYASRAMAMLAQDLGIRVSRGEAQRELDAQIDSVIAQRAANDTPEQKAQLRAQLRGQLSVDDVQRGLLQQRLQEHFTARSRPMEVHIAQIVIPFRRPDGIRTDEDARELATTAWRQASVPNADFARLADQYSQDPTKAPGGVFGWVSADPTNSAAQGDAAPRVADDAIVGAALALNVGQVSDLVRTGQGYHVIKALDERPFAGTNDAAAAAGAAAGQTSPVQAYQQKVVDAIMAGVRAQLEWKYPFQAVSPLLKAIIADRDARIADGTTEAGRAQIQAAIDQYLAALQSPSIEQAAALEFAVGQLYERLGDDANAIRHFEAVTNRSASAEAWMAIGDLHQKGGRNTDALQAYQKAADIAFLPNLRSQLVEKFKAVGRDDLAGQQQQLYDEYIQRQAEQNASLTHDPNDPNDHGHDHDAQGNPIPRAAP